MVAENEIFTGCCISNSCVLFLVSVLFLRSQHIAMKRSYIILTAIASFVAVSALHALFETGKANSLNEALLKKKKLAFNCSPDYVPAANDNIPLLSGWGDYGWKVTTSSDSAQIYFNQGINMYYAFHIIESRASFDKATRFDPDCAMAWWGKALAYGPNINDFEYQQPSDAYLSAQKANTLKNNATPAERSLIEAMAIRYAKDSVAGQEKRNQAYCAAMQKVFKAFRQNANVSVLYADALMLLHPWDLYNHDFSPKPWTNEIVSVLKHSLRLDPKQPGANHYYIHALEASAKPGDATASATFLASAMPDVSHLTHMPSHIYIRTGVYDKGITVNERALNGYRKYLQYFPATGENSVLYELHNLHMKLNCAQMAGNYRLAMDASVDLQKQIPGFYLSLPGALGNYVQYLHQSIIFTQLRFGKWEEILREQLVDTLSYTAALQLFARGVSYARTNRLNLAKDALANMSIKLSDPALKEPLMPFNSAYDELMVGKLILSGVIAETGEDYASAISYLQEAVMAEDKLIYNEPRDWLLPARHYLGNAYIRAKKYTDAIQVFNKDLEINPNNGWALSGLKTCYQGLQQKKALGQIENRLKAAWSIKDQEITVAAF